MTKKQLKEYIETQDTMMAEIDASLQKLTFENEALRSIEKTMSVHVIFYKDGEKFVETIKGDRRLLRVDIRQPQTHVDYQFNKEGSVSSVVETNNEKTLLIYDKWRTYFILDLETVDMYAINYTYDEDVKVVKSKAKRKPKEKAE